MTWATLNPTPERNHSSPGQNSLCMFPLVTDHPMQSELQTAMRRLQSPLVLFPGTAPYKCPTAQYVRLRRIKGPENQCHIPPPPWHPSNEASFCVGKQLRFESEAPRALADQELPGPCPFPPSWWCCPSWWFPSSLPWAPASRPKSARRKTADGHGKVHCALGALHVFVG